MPFLGTAVFLGPRTAGDPQQTLAEGAQEHEEDAIFLGGCGKLEPMPGRGTGMWGQESRSDEGKLLLAEETTCGY